MKSTLVRLSAVAVCTAASTSLFAQTSIATHRATSTAHHTSSVVKTTGCATVPTLSPKIPALPAGLPCPKILYGITSSATQLSPLLSPQLKESLQKLNQSFSMAYVDTKIGTGPLSAQRMYYTVNYTGWTTDGKKFDSSFDHDGGTPFTFPAGARRVITGWDTGFEGMRIGGKRRLIVPYELAYGELGRAPVIPPKATLIFDVEFLAQSSTPPGPPPPSGPPAGTVPQSSRPETKPVVKPGTNPETDPKNTTNAPNGTKPQQ